MRLLGIAVLIAMGIHSGYGQTQTQMNANSCGKLDAADAELNLVYRRILKSKADDAEFVQKFRRAQRAWLAFRDAHFDAIFPSSNPGLEYGSAFPICKCGILQQLTVQRTEQLKKLWIEGSVEGNICIGSSVVKSNGN